MSRTDDDSWDVTKGVGATALGVAYARALETGAEHPLIVDPFAQVFIEAATALGWEAPAGAQAERIKHISAYAAARTKWFDDFFVAASGHGVGQAVILAAGLDARAWRLPWAPGSTVFEIDQPQVLAFKVETLHTHGTQPVAQHVAVPVDLRQDWPKALRDSGFDADAPTAWSAEGLLPYLPATAQDLLFERINALSAPGSRLGVESFGAGFFDPEYLAERSAQVRKLREQAGEDSDAPEVADLWFIEERTNVQDWLSANGWSVSEVSAADLMHRYGQDPGATAIRTEFVEGVSQCRRDT
jgi:methyltransferase (TIGR00027 family)